jgi:hypothetical protein
VRETSTRSAPALGHPIDRLTQTWVRATGRRVQLDSYAWLHGPIGGPESIGDGWIQREATRLGGHVPNDGELAGLLPSMSTLTGEGFDPILVRPEIVDFYEHTAAWRMELWSQWCPAALPFGWLLSLVFARRLQQFSLPLRPLEVAKGIDSRVIQVVDQASHHIGAAWIRTLRATGQFVYSGWYGTAVLPHTKRPSPRVAFPLPNGSATVFLQPDVVHGGNLRLTSPAGRFGDQGMYLIVHESDSGYAWVRRAPIIERFDVYVDQEGTVRTDHELRLWTIPALRLHYRLEHKAR